MEMGLRFIEEEKGSSFDRGGCLCGEPKKGQLTTAELPTLPIHNDCRRGALDYARNHPETALLTVGLVEPREEFASVFDDAPV
jgi:hypothetical protein